MDYRLWVNQLISDQQDFMIESNLADERSYEWINSMKKKGYQLVLYFLSTQDVAINFQRVNKRVQEGGHPVPEPIIESRYKQGHSYLKTKLQVFNEVYLIDNSTDTPLIQAHIANDAITILAETLVNWAKEITAFYEKVQRIRNK